MITKEVYTETYIVLETLDLLKKLPQNVLNTIESNIIPNYEFCIDKNIPVKFQIYNKDTLTLLSYIYIKYFCENQEEKNILRVKFDNNEDLNKNKRKQEYELVFRKNIEKEKEELKEDTLYQETNLIERKRNSFVTRIIEKIIRFFRNIK